MAVHPCDTRSLLKNTVFRQLHVELPTQRRSDRELTSNARMVLDAYVDRQTTPEERQRALTLLNASSAARDYVDACRRQNELLKKLNNLASDELLPERVRSRLKMRSGLIN